MPFHAAVADLSLFIAANCTCIARSVLLTVLTGQIIQARYAWMPFNSPASSSV